MRTFTIVLLVLTSLCPSLPAQTPPPPAKRLPPAGITINDSDREELRRAVDKFYKESPKKRAGDPSFSDVSIFYKAVDWALRYDEFFDRGQVAFAKRLLEQGHEREQQMNQRPWLTETGLVVRGYQSKLDGSIQPYGLVIPSDWKADETTPRPLLVWLLGRNDKQTELAFLAEREKSVPPFHPAGAIVLIPYGRFCNATKFAGEVDVFESIANVQAQYQIDTNRVFVAGFSMGGASAWHLAVHHSGFWCGASPGAGFADTAIYTKTPTTGPAAPPMWEQKLWRYYDATAVAGNLFNCPTIAFSGEIDPQKQSADLMEEAMAKEGLKLERIIGPATAHKYHPDSQRQLAERFDSILQQGRKPVPNEVRLTTYTLRFAQAHWVRIDGLGQHWERADVRARRGDDGAVMVQTTNVTGFTLTLPGLKTVTVNGQKIGASADESEVSFYLEGEQWKVGREGSTLRKQPGLSGPIDDAFLDPFVFVKPSGSAFHKATDQWVNDELQHATKMWRDIFRGDVPMIDDTAVTEADIAGKNLVLWGDPASNQLLAKLLKQLPVQWTSEELIVGSRHYDAAHHMPILVFPNPLSPSHYVVLNSGIDFREDAYGTNAKQTPKLPDWAVVDLKTPPGSRWPGAIAAAGFFDEHWR